MTRTFDITPTWEEITPLLARILRDADAVGQENALAELLRMARLADLYAAQQTKKETK